jgi:hypothetical protein
MAFAGVLPRAKIKTLDIGREAITSDVSALVKNLVQEPGILARETVVVLPPDRGSNRSESPS